MASAKQEILGQYLDRLRGEDRLLGDDLRQSRPRATETDPDGEGLQEARRILNKALQDKSISRPDLKRAMALYAGKQATEDERDAADRRVIDFLNKKKIRLTY
jgi:hypothetical protein